MIQGDNLANDLGSSSQTAPVTINGGGGADTIRGGTGADQLNGDDGNDLIIGWGGADTMNGGAGIDTVSYATETGTRGLVVNLATTAWINAGVTYQGLTGSDSWGAIDTYVGIERLIGSAKDDIINAAGTLDLNWYIDGGAGDDTLIGSLGGGNFDTLVGGAGDDTLDTGWARYEGSAAVYVDFAAGTATGQGNDTLIKIYGVTSGDGDDTLMGSSSQETMDGGAGNDIIFSGGGSDTIMANKGSDTVYGYSSGYAKIFGNGSTTLSYENATGAILASLGDGQIKKAANGVAGWLTEDTASQIHTLIGSAFGDIMSGGAADRVLKGMGGDDTIVGSGTIDGGIGNDSRPAAGATIQFKAAPATTSLSVMTATTRSMAAPTATR